VTFWLALVLLAAPSGSCLDLPSTRQLLERARSFEITDLENDHASALLEGCRALETSRAAVEAKYRGLVEEVEASCRAPLA